MFILSDGRGEKNAACCADEPFGYPIVFSQKDAGFVFRLESIWQGYLGRMSVDCLGFLDLLVTYAQPAPDAPAAWQTMYKNCLEVVDTLLMQEGVALEYGEYLAYKP